MEDPGSTPCEVARRRYPPLPRTDDRGDLFESSGHDSRVFEDVPLTSASAARFGNDIKIYTSNGSHPGKGGPHCRCRPRGPSDCYDWRDGFRARNCTPARRRHICRQDQRKEGRRQDGEDQAEQPRLNPRIIAEVRAENRAAHGGKLTCVKCGRDDLIDPPRARGGVPNLRIRPK